MVVPPELASPLEPRRGLLPFSGILRLVPAFRCFLKPVLHKPQRCVSGDAEDVPEVGSLGAGLRIGSVTGCAILSPKIKDIVPPAASTATSPSARYGLPIPDLSIERG